MRLSKVKSLAKTQSQIKWIPQSDPLKFPPSLTLVLMSPLLHQEALESYTLNKYMITLSGYLIRCSSPSLSQVMPAPPGLLLSEILLDK